MQILDGKIKTDSTLKILYLTPGMLLNPKKV
jgi:hypothetical protein